MTYLGCMGMHDQWAGNIPESGYECIGHTVENCVTGPPKIRAVLALGLSRGYGWDECDRRGLSF